MKKQRLLIGLVLALVAAAITAGREPLVYFVMLCAITYFVAKLAFDVPRPHMARRVRLFTLGGVAIVLTGGLTWLISYLASSPSTREWLDDDIGYVIMILMASSVIVACIWIEFCRALKKRVPK